MKKIDFKKIWIYFFLFCFSLIVVCSISKSFVFSLILLFLIFLILRKFKINNFSIFIFLISFILRLIVIFIIKTPPESDFLVLYNASKDILNNNYSFLDSNYFQIWSYQVGFVYFQSLLLRIFNSIIFLKIINSLVSSFTILLIYKISREFVNEQASKFVSIIYSILPFTLTYVTVLTNQYFASLLIYLSFYLIISKKIKIKDNLKYIISAILIGIANVIRPESVIPILSILIFLILTINKENIKEKLLNIGSLLGTYLFIVFLISSLFNITGFTVNGLKNNDPYWKFVLGFNHETGGTYSEEDSVNIGNTNKEIELLKERVFTSPVKLSYLFYRKIQTFWSTTSLNWSFSYLYQKNSNILNLVILLENTNSTIMIFLYILTIYGIYKYKKNKNYNQYIILFINQVFVTFGIFLLIEVQARYAYHIQISIAILASLGFNELYKYVNKKINLKKYNYLVDIMEDV